MKREIAEKAAQWWAKQLEQGGVNNGDSSPTGMIVAIYGAKIQAEARKENSADKVEKFTTLLADHLMECQSDYCSLGVDYDPDMHLETVCAAAGVNGGALPIKTMMWIQGDQIKVRKGYGAPIVELQ